MKKYKINGIIVEAKSVLDGISKIKDDITSDIPYMLNMAKDYASNSDWQKVANICYSIVDKLKRAKLADSNIKDENLFMIVDKNEGAYIYNIKSNSNSILSYNTTYNSKLASKFSKQEAENIIKKLENNIDWKNQFKLSEFIDDSNTKDSLNYNYLLSEERKAVEDYRKSISETADKNELYVLSHILKEEAHHIELLENLQKGKVEFNDSGKCFYTQRRGVIYVYIDYNLVGKFSSKKEAIDAGYDIDGAIKFNANYETK